MYTSPTQVRILTADGLITDDQLFPGLRLPVASLFQPSAGMVVRQ